MVGVRYSARSPRAFAVRGREITVSDISNACLFAGLSAAPTANASDVRADLEGGDSEGGDVVDRAERDTAAALSGNLNGTPLSLSDQLCALRNGRKLRRLPIGGEAGARSIRDTAFTVVADDDGLWRQPPQRVQARVQGEPRTRQGGCP
jgi:hypothetical protein